MCRVRRRRDVFVPAAGEEGGERSQEAGRLSEGPVLLEAEFEQALAQEDDDLRPRQDADVRRKPQLEREFADEPVPEGVEGRDGRVRVPVRNELVDTELHRLSR